MPIPIELSGFAIAGISALIAMAAIAITWLICTVVDEWREADFEAGKSSGDREGDA